MQRRQLGNSDMEITPIGLGAWAMGGADWKAGWGPQDDQDSIDTIHKAVDMGINWIDTAAVYGLGHSEEVVGKAIKSLTNKPYIFTKCARHQDDAGNLYSSQNAAMIRQECEDSLRRLQVDAIDLYQIHWPQPDEDIEEGWQTLKQLQDEGKVRWIGISNFSVAQMERVKAIAPITSLQPPYNVNRRGIEDEILPYCETNNIGVIVYSPMQSGLLTGRITKERMATMPESDWRSRNPEFQEPRLSRNLALVDILKDIATEHNVKTAEVAIAWTLRKSAVTAAIVGARRPDQIDGIIGAAAFRLSQDEIARIDAFLQANP